MRAADAEMPCDPVELPLLEDLNDSASYPVFVDSLTEGAARARSANGTHPHNELRRYEDISVRELTLLLGR